MKRSKLLCVLTAAAHLWLVLTLAPSAKAQPNPTFILFSEGFEGVFPGTWSVGNPSGGPTWRDVNAAFGGEGTHTDAWKGYCAGTAYPFNSTEPNPLYTDNMAALMSRSFDLAGYNAGQLTFWYKIPSIESCCDVARVYVDADLVWSNNVPTADWTQATISLNGYVGGVHTLTFIFQSDLSIAAEGWYLDDINIAVTAVAPSLTTQPQSQTVVAGNNAAFTVAANGTPPLSYQWRFNEANLSGATSSSYTVINAQSANAGNYAVVVSNAWGSVTSVVAVLTVNVPPTITTHPQSQTVVAGNSATFTVVASGTSPLSYQWRFNGANLGSATSSTYTVLNAQPANAGNYSVVVGNAAGSVTSAVAALTVNVPPTITTQPQSQTVVAGNNATFTVVAGGTSPLSYQWRFNGANLGGAVSSSYTVLNAQSAVAGNYTVVVSNSAGSVTSAVASLTVTPPTLPNDDFANATLIAGGTGSVSGNNTGATGEPNEPPNHGRTVWYRWVPLAEGAYFFSVRGSAFSAEVAVYAGSSLAGLSLVARGEGFFARTGTVYHIRIDSSDGSQGTVALQWGLVLDHLAEVRLNRLVYAPGGLLTATVSGVKSNIHPHALRLIVAAGSNDVEVLPLVATAQPGVYQTTGSLLIETPAAPGNFTRLDGNLTLVAGEKFVAMFLPYDSPIPANGPPNLNELYFSDLAADFGVMEDLTFNAGSLQVQPLVAMTDDEINVPPGGKRIGTLAAPGGLAVQVPLDELVFYPRNAGQLAQFLAESGGQILMDDTTPNSGPAPRAYLVRVNPNVADVLHAPQMRALLGEQEPLLASSPDTFKIYTLAMQFGLEGFVVGLNPRLQFMDAPRTRDGLDGKPGPDGKPGDHRFDAVSGDIDAFKNVPFGVRDAWAFLALWDKDTARIPVAVLDMGFAPNWDFRGYNPDVPGFGIIQKDLEGGTGSAVGPPTVGNSFFGERSWHGNGVVTTLGGVLNNGWGAMGVGGQVVVPMLYKTGLRSYAFEMGRGIKLATDDGASIINISAGYPCRLNTRIGSIDICDPAGRAALCAGLSVVVTTAAIVVCAIPVIGIFVCPAAIAAGTAASVACFATLLAGDPGDEMAKGVKYALAKGVPVVSIAGNVPSSESLGILCDIVYCDAGDVSDWKIIPGTLPGVICVGAARDTSPYTNLHYYGGRVDIWAPIGERFFNPPNVDVVVSGDAQTLQEKPFGGTSAAAPYISGVIAMMQAMDPTLDRRTPGLTEAQIKGIPERIRRLLVDNATPASALPADPSGRRRNLVNAFASLKAAAPAVIRSFDWPAYDARLGFDETAASNDDSDKTATQVNAAITTVFRQTILSLPGTEPPGKGKTFTDVDWFAWGAPPGAGVYDNGRIELLYPAGYGKIYINGEEGTLLPMPPGSTEEKRQFLIPATFAGCTQYFRLSASSPSDNVYIISFLEAKRKDFVSPPDRFDRIETNPLGLPNNNHATRAIPLISADWITTKVTRFYTTKQVLVSGLNLHSNTDQDWFRLAAPPGEDVTDCDYACVTSFEVEAGEAATVSLHHEFESTPVGPLFWPVIGLPGDSVNYRCEHLQGKFPLLIRIANGTCSPIVYDLKITWTTYSQDHCEEFKREASTLDRTIRWDSYVSDGPGWGPFPPDPTKGPWSYPTDADGRITTPVDSIIDWRGGGPFRLQVRVPVGASMLAKLLGRDQRVLAHSATADLIPRGAAPAAHPARVAQGNEPPLVPAIQSGQETLILEFNLPDLAPGSYILSLSLTRYNTPVEILLPRNATSDHSIPLEDRLNPGFVPGDLDSDGLLTEADMQVASLFASHQANPTPDQLTHGDANGNGMIDPDDVQRLQGALAGTRDLFAEWPTPIFRFPLNKSVFELDSDGDGVPDWWEYSFGLDPHDPADAGLDSDQDRLSNLAEYQAGTNPLDAQAYLKVQSITSAANQFLIRFQAVANKSYTVQYRNSLSSGNWYRLADVESQPYYRNIELADQIRDGGNQRFYRLVTPDVP